MRAEDRVGEGRLLPFLRVRRQLFDGEVVDRLAQLFVLVGEDEVLALGLEVGLDDALGGGGHSGGSPWSVALAVAAEREQHRGPLRAGGRFVASRVVCEAIAGRDQSKQ